MADAHPVLVRAIRLIAVGHVALVLAACASVQPQLAAPSEPSEAIATPTPAPAPEPATPATPAGAASEPALAAPAAETPSLQAIGGDPDSVTNATLQLRSEYGDLWSRLRQGFVLPDIDLPLVKKAEDWYSARPDYVARMVERSRRYLYHIVAAVEKRGMPLEIALLPMIESAYNPMAYSRSRASGIWQFIPSTGKFYGLKQNWWFDERRDVVAATEGALDYLQKLYDEFGNWYLALAAYNWGEGSVRRAIAYNMKRGLPTDYANLKMPTETREYVPKLQAVKNIVRSPEAYNFELADIPDAPYFAVVHTSKKIDVKVAAELAEMPVDEFLSLNPQHNRPVIAGADETTILLPYDRAELFVEKLELSDQPMVTWQAYKFRAGESLAQVATRFGMPLETLRAVNGIGPQAKVPIGHALLVPSQVPSDATAASLQHAVFTTVPSAHTFYHRVKKGETLASIASRYNVSTQELKDWNGGLRAHIVAGQRLRVISDVDSVGGKKSRGAKLLRAVHTNTASKASGVVKSRRSLGIRRTQHP